MSIRLKRQIHNLHTLNSCKLCLRKSILKNAPEELIICLSEICLNILKGNIPISKSQKSKLFKYRKLMRDLVTIKGNKKEIIKKNRSKLVQNGGFLPLLLGPLLSIISEIIQNST